MMFVVYLLLPLLVAGDNVIVVYDLNQNDTLCLNVTAVPPSVYVPGTQLISNITTNGIRIDTFEITHCINIDPDVEWELVCNQFMQFDSVLSCELDAKVLGGALQLSGYDMTQPNVNCVGKEQI